MNEVTTSNANNANNANNNSVSKASDKGDIAVPHSHNVRANTLPPPATGGDQVDDKAPRHSPGAISALSADPTATKSVQDEEQGIVIETNANQDNLNNSDKVDNDPSSKKKRTVMEEIRRTLWMVATYSWLNVLLVFVPVGIVVANIGGVHAGVIFAVNCVAVVPLAGLLAFATESVASNMGDALGALLNVTFGNAVELIIL